MKTKMTTNQEIEQIVENLLFWVIMLAFVIIQYDYLAFNNPMMCAFWFASMLATIPWIFCLNLPTGARKYAKRWFIPSNNAVDASKIRNEIKKQNRQALKIALIWIIFLILEGLALYLNIITEKEVILGLIILRIVDQMFVMIWCPFGAIMKNKCCTTCRIYGWNQLMLNSPMIFFPAVYSYSLIILSMIPFIQWEVAIRRHPERFSARSNAAIRCSNCPGICGRCRCKKMLS